MTVDTLTPEQRSDNMRRIRAVNTGPEAAVRTLLRRAGVRVRRHPVNVPGNPDFAVVGMRVAIFVNGCFWHSHGCLRGRRPKSNLAYWSAKLERNVRRDRRYARLLRREGWKRLVIWECELRNTARVESKLARVFAA